MIGGYSRRFNIYQAALEEELPFNFQLPVQKVADVVDQTIFACERAIESQSNNVKETFRQTPKRIASVAGWFFPSAIQRVVFGWALMALIVGTVLRFVFGFHLEQIGQLVTKWAFK